MIGVNRKITHSLRSGPHLPLILTKSSSFSPIGPRLGLFFRPRSRSAYPYSRPKGTVRVKTFTHKALSNLGEAHSTQAGCRQLRVTYIRKGDESPEVGNYRRGHPAIMSETKSLIGLTSSFKTSIHRVGVCMYGAMEPLATPTGTIPCHLTGMNHWCTVAA